MDKLLVTNIQRFSLNDGPGIRTTIFLKGCSLKCPWCCNPENISYQAEPFIKDGVEGKYGDWYDINEIYKEIMKDQTFYEPVIVCEQKEMNENYTRGGVTFSGGECLLQSDSLLNLMKILKRDNVNIVVETALFVPQSALEKVVNYVDLFYIDMKIMDKKLCEKILHGDIELYKQNVRFLVERNIRFVVRIPMIEAFIMNKKNLEQIIEQLREIKAYVLRVELLQEHYMGEDKYKSLIEAGNTNLHIPERHSIDIEKYVKFKEEIKQLHLNVEIKFV